MYCELIYNPGYTLQLNYKATSEFPSIKTDVVNMHDLIKQLRESQKAESLFGEEVKFVEFIEPDQGMFLYNLIKDNKCNLIIELGLAMGTSALYMLQACADQGQGLVLSVDPFQHVAYKGVALRNIQRAGLEKQHLFMEERSEYMLPSFAKAGIKANLVFIDTSHLFDQTIVEAYYADKILQVGGIIAFDDTYMPAIRSACNFLESNLGYLRHPLEKDKHPGLSNMCVMIKTKDDYREASTFTPFNVER